MNWEIAGIAFYMLVSIFGIVFFAGQYFKELERADRNEDDFLRQTKISEDLMVEVEKLRAEVAKKDSLISILKLEIEEKENRNGRKAKDDR